MKKSFVRHCGFYSLLSMMVILGSACSKNSNTIILGSDPDIINPGKPDYTEALVQFRANVESSGFTKSVSVYPANKYATVFAYGANANSLATPLNRIIYKSQQAGDLTPAIDNRQMYLPNGNYNLFAVSTLSSQNINPTFTNGKSSSTLSNGVDYLWWGENNTSIAASKVTVPITFSHSCTQIVFKINSGNGIAIDKMIKATITPSSTTNASMSLSNGVITPATTLSTPTAMGVNSLVAQYIMLPLNYTGNLTATFSLFINLEPVSRNYSVNVPVPEQGYEAGKSYLYSAVINGNEIVFNPVSIIDWIPVDETGVPLYPNQIN